MFIYMEKLWRASFFYLIAGLLSGIYFREMTKIYDFQGFTQLGVVHTHLLVLGMLFFLIVMLFEKNFHLTHQKSYRAFFGTYNSGLGIMILMLLVNGTRTVLGQEITPMFAGIAGLGHIIITIGFIFFFLTLKQAMTANK